MSAEEKIAAFVCDTRYADIPSDVAATVKHQILGVIGTTLAGAAADGCPTAIQFHRALGAKPEATILVHGGRIPAHDAAFVNATMARALDFCDALERGPHPGSAVIPAALAATELAGGCSGKDFLAAVAVGTETAARLNLPAKAYDGFDPTGICVPFGAAAAAAKLLGLNHKQTWNALGLAFNACGGSFQSNIDGSLGVRYSQGRVAQSGVFNARLAAQGISGPRNFLDGIYGYFHLYGKDLLTGAEAMADLGSSYELRDLVFKKYPSCALTASSTEVILRLVAEENLESGDVEHIKVTLPPYAYRLVGHPFAVGDNPTVNAQFSIQYCVANALLRKSSKIAHFDEPAITHPAVARLVHKIHVFQCESPQARSHTSVDIEVTTRSGKNYSRKLDIAPGYPGNALSREDHERRFRDCVDYAAKPGARENAPQIAALIDGIEQVADMRELIPLLT